MSSISRKSNPKVELLHSKKASFLTFQSDCVYCQGCNVILSRFSNLIKTDDNSFTWRCEFCSMGITIEVPSLQSECINAKKVIKKRVVLVTFSDEVMTYTQSNSVDCPVVIAGDKLEDFYHLIKIGLSMTYDKLPTASALFACAAIASQKMLREDAICTDGVQNVGFGVQVYPFQIQTKYTKLDGVGCLRVVIAQLQETPDFNSFFFS
ncbi:hypothetical protein ACTFIY_004300 [Dictyostelium cf. discoideum]